MRRKTGSTAPVAVALLAVAVLSGCAQPYSTGADGIPGVTPAAEAHDPQVLIGTWDVTPQGAADDSARIRMTLSDGGLRLHVDCGDLLGSWSAHPDGPFTAHIWGSTSTCAPGPAPTWLRDTRAFRPTDTGPLLLDATGAASAILKPELGQTGSAAEDTDTPRQGPHIVTDLPSRFTPPAPSEWLGSWVPVGGPGSSHLQLAADGTWTGSDGCNDQSGTWSAATNGALAATMGPTTVIWCDGVSLGADFARATAAGLDGGALVLLDAAGNELRRLTRD